MTEPRALGGLFAALDAAGLDWMLLRPRESLSAPAGDVDVLVDRPALERAAAVVEGAGFVSLPVPGGDIHAADYDGAAGRFVWIHVQPELRVAGAAMPGARLLREAHGPSPREPAPDWLLWILLLRALVDKGALPDRHRPAVMRLAAGWGGGPSELVSLASARGLDPRRAVAAAAAGDWEALLAQRVRPAQPRGRPLGRARQVASRLRRPRLRRGLSVAVIGADGAGKTTLVRALSQSLPMPTVILYMGLTGGRMKRADALRVPGVVLAAKLAVIWARYALALAHRARGRVVLFERFTLDGAVPSGRPLSAPGRMSRRIQRRACPAPDLVLLLDASGETMHARKGEYTGDVLEHWRSEYLRLRDAVPVLEVIDAEQPREAVRRLAEAAIWRRYASLRSDR